MKSVRGYISCVFYASLKKLLNEILNPLFIRQLLRAHAEAPNRLCLRSDLRDGVSQMTAL